MLQTPLGTAAKSTKTIEGTPHETSPILESLSLRGGTHHRQAMGLRLPAFCLWPDRAAHNAPKCRWSHRPVDSSEVSLSA
eukprot:4580817-Amphidinium_carterae.1